MQVSVAVATYNGGRFLWEQLDSIRRQTTPPVEVVISDDGSTDDTVEVASRFAAGAPFRVVVDAHGQRLGFTRNFVRAIGRCTGEIVALCDQDDMWDRAKLATATAPFADPAVGTVTHRVRVVDAHLTPTPLLLPEGSYRGRYTVSTIDPWFSPNGMQMLFRRARIAPWLDRTAPLSAYGFGTAPFDEWIFYLGTVTGSAVLLQDTLGVWRRHGASLTLDVASIQEQGGAAHKVRLALHSGAEAYAYRAEVTDARAEFASHPPDGFAVPTVARAVDFYRQMSGMYRRRVCLHTPQASRFQRLCTFGRMVANNDYRGRDQGGLGIKAILKDGFTIFFGPRRPLPRPHAGAR